MTMAMIAADVNAVVIFCCGVSRMRVIDRCRPPEGGWSQPS